MKWSRARTVVGVVLTLLSASVAAQGIEGFVVRQMQSYPKLRLLDIYKSCFQDYMGAEHLVSDRQGVKAYLDKELETTSLEDLMPWYYEPCGTDSSYYRVSLRAVKEGIITEEQLLDAFVRSANCQNKPTVESWAGRWHQIVGVIDSMALSLPRYDRDKQFIDSILSVGKYAISHSADYREAYRPHYRIVERGIFERELRPAIDKRHVAGKAFPLRHKGVQEHSPSVFLVMYDTEIGKKPLLKAIKKYKAEVVYDYNIIHGMAIKKPDGKTLEETMHYFKTVKGVLTVEYDRVYHLTDPVRPTLELE